MDFIIGGTAAVGAGVFSNPFEVLKTRMQLRGELLPKKHYRGIHKNSMQVVQKIIKRDGVLGLQKGLYPALWVQFISNGVKLGIYRSCEERGFVQDNNGNSEYFKSAAVGGAAGVVGHILANPFYLVKTQLQSPPGCKTSEGDHNHSTRGMWHVMRDIYQKHGVWGLYRGASGSIPRAFVGTSGQLTAFKYCKEALSNFFDLFSDNPLMLTVMSSLIGGAIICATTTPFDLIMIRLYHQPVDAKGKGRLYNSYLDCIVKIYKTEGVRGFYKGAGPLGLRLGPHSVLCLVFWDELKAFQEKYQDTNNTIEYSKLYN